MGLETATYIADLVATNPVGASDFVSQGDDHIRLIKSALQATFPNANGAVNFTPAQANLLASLAAVSVLGRSANSSGAPAAIAAGSNGLMLGRLADALAFDTPANFGLVTLANAQTVTGRKSFTATSSSSDGAPINILPTAGAARINYAAPDETDDEKRWSVGTQTGGIWAIATTADANWSAVSNGIRLVRDGTAITQIDLNATTLLDINSPLVRLDSNANLAIQGGTLTIQGTNETLATFADDGAVVLYYDNAARIATTSGGASVTGTLAVSGAVTAATVASSTSTTLAAGQLHFISGNATLPNLAAGQWVQVVNDSASPITISKNGSDTTYWATTGATVSTSFTLAARGVLTARANADGSAVYVTGAGITAAT